MAFKELDQRLIDECCKNNVDLDIIKSLIAGGADINAFDEEYQQELYNEILHYYIEAEQPNLSNLYEITKVFLANDLVLNQKPEDSDWFLPGEFRFLPPEELCVSIYKLLLDKGGFSFKDLDDLIADAVLDLRLGLSYFYEDTQYTEEDSINYYLELIYWACAYQVRVYPEKCSEDVLPFNWFEREKNKIEIISENRSTAVFVEDLETHRRAEI